MESLTGEPEKTVNAAGSLVWRLERSYVEKRIRSRLPLSDGILYNQISLNGMKATALGMAGAYWAVVGFVILVIGILTEQIFDSSENTFKWSGLVLACLVFLISAFRTFQSIASQIRYRSNRR